MHSKAGCSSTCAHDLTQHARPEHRHDTAEGRGVRRIVIVVHRDGESDRPLRQYHCAHLADTRIQALMSSTGIIHLSGSSPMPDLSIESSMPTPVKRDDEAGFAWHAVAESATRLVFMAMEDAWMEWYQQRSQVTRERWNDLARCTTPSLPDSPRLYKR